MTRYISLPGTGLLGIAAKRGSDKLMGISFCAAKRKVAARFASQAIRVPLVSRRRSGLPTLGVALSQSGNIEILDRVAGTAH